MRFDKPIGIYLLAYPVIWSLLLSKTSDIKIWLIFMLGIIVMRSAGCIINDFADRDIDKFVARTQARPLTTGDISPKNALILFSGLIIFALFLVLQTNMLTIQLSIIAVVLTIIYPFAKRFFPVPQLFLSLGFAMSVPMSFGASLGYLPNSAWLVFLATIFWVISYDTMYAMSDKKDDLKIGVKSSAIFFGTFDKIIIGLLQFCMLICLIIIGKAFMLNFWYFIGLVVMLALMIYHQYLIKNRDRKLCFQAFLHNNYIGLVITLAIIANII
jgi:4-hydroxybenzoate polyprenyltransferase